MTKSIALLLEGIWWLYLASWKCGEWIISNPGKFWTHLFQPMLVGNAPIVLQMFVGAVPEGQINESGNLSLSKALAQTADAVTSTVLCIDKVAAIALLAVAIASTVHVLLEAAD